MSCRFCNLAIAGLLAATSFANSVCRAQLAILSTEFVSDEGYQDGDLQFQSISNGTEGTWLGHSGAAVTSGGAGKVTRIGDPRRDLFNRGVTGGLAGGDGSGELLGAGFAVGEVLTITHGYSFESSSMPITGLLKTGIRHNYVNGGFESLPLIGLSLEYVNAGSGELRIYGNLSRTAENNADSEYAMIVAASDVGIDNGASGGQLDFESDQLALTWVGEYVGIDTWKTREILIDNVTNQFSARASVANPLALERIKIQDSGIEAFFGMQQLQEFVGVGVTDSVELLYEPLLGNVPGDFDSDMDVDGTDLLSWQRDALPNDQLLIWKSRYGVAVSTLQTRSTVVPEPGSIALLLICISQWGFFVPHLNNHRLFFTTPSR